MAADGVVALFYPTAIGSEPILDCDSMMHRRRCMHGQAAFNLGPAVADNRIGFDTVKACEETGGQPSSLKFYCSSFITDNTGDIIYQAGRDEEEVIVHKFDLDKLAYDRLSWGLFRDRRPEVYNKAISKELIQP